MRRMGVSTAALVPSAFAVSSISLLPSIVTVLYMRDKLLKINFKISTPRLLQLMSIWC